MRKHTLTRGGLLLAAALVVGLGGAGAAMAHQDTESVPPPEPTGDVRASAIPVPPTTVEHEQGIVLEGSGATDGRTVMATLYENSRYGSSLQVVLGDPEEDRIGFVEQAGAFVVDGRLDVEVVVEGEVVSLTGTVEEAGKPTRITEPAQDAGEQLVIRGTNTQLRADVTVTYDGVEIPMEFAPAFAFDLETRRTTLYGN